MNKRRILLKNVENYIIINTGDKRNL